MGNAINVSYAEDFLADTVGSINGMRIAVRSQCCEAGPVGGGDWYLSLPLPGGDLVLSVGDVVGHGSQAAATMTGLRYAVAAFAATDTSPAAILTELNDLLCARHGDLTATALIARYRPADGLLTWAQAGHPPMLLADDHGTRILASPPGMLLGAIPAQIYAQRALHLAPGDLLCMYTDGIVEQNRDIDHGTTALIRRLTTTPRLPEAALDRLDFTGLRDDACVLLAQPLI